MILILKQVDMKIENLYFASIDKFYKSPRPKSVCLKVCFV